MSGHQQFRCRITGVSAILQHSGRLIDPMDPHSRAIAEISKKLRKSDSDLLEMSRREWRGGLYLHEGRPCIPAEAIEAAIVKGAMAEKRGPAAKAGIIVLENAVLEYDGPSDLDALWADERFRLRVPVKVGQARVMRTRPRFDGWAAELSISFVPSLLNERDVLQFLITAGKRIGLGDWRPRFGRFEVAR